MPLASNLAYCSEGPNDSKPPKTKYESVTPAEPLEVPIVETETKKSIYKTLELIHEKRLLGLIYGSPGLGKTVALKSYVSRNYDCWLVTMSEASASISQALERIAEAVGVANPPTRAYALEKTICKKFEDSLGCLFIDEAQCLSRRSLEAIRYIYDSSDIGLALIGNEFSYSRLVGGSRSAAFAQIFSRIGIQKHLIKPKIADVTSIIDACGIKGRKEKEFLQALSMKPGALREVTLTIELAAQIAAGASAPLDITHLRAAFKYKGGGQL